MAVEEYSPGRWKKTGLKFTVKGVYRHDDNGSIPGKRTNRIGAPQGPLGPLGFPPKNLLGKHVLIDGHVWKVTGLAGLQGEAIPADTPAGGVGGLIAGGAALLFAAVVGQKATTTIEGVEATICEEPIIHASSNKLRQKVSHDAFRLTVDLHVLTVPGWSDFFARASLVDDSGLSPIYPWTEADFTFKGDHSRGLAQLSVQFEVDTFLFPTVTWSFVAKGGVVFWGDNICPPPGKVWNPNPADEFGYGKIVDGSVVIVEQ